MIRTGIICGCCWLALASPAAGEWQTRAPMPYPAGQAAVTRGLDGRFYLFGGWNSNPVSLPDTRRLQIYDPAADHWTPGAAIPNYCVGDMAITLPRGTIHLLNAYFKEIFVYDPVSDTFSPPISAPWITYAARIIRSRNGRYFVFGGERPDSLAYEYFPATFTAQPLAAVPYSPEPHDPSIRFPGVYAGDFGHVFSIGGLTNNWQLHGALDDVAAYNPVTGQWLQEAADMPTRRFSFGYVTGWDGRFYALGGSDNYWMQEAPYWDVVEYYDPRTDSWSAGPPLPAGRREATAAIDDQGIIYLFGGSGPPDGAYVTTVYALDTLTPRAIADADGDGDVDHADLQTWIACQTGPQSGPPAGGCGWADLDQDTDVDSTDFGILQTCLSGELVADPLCGRNDSIRSPAGKQPKRRNNATTERDCPGSPASLPDSPALQAQGSLLMRIIRR